MPGTRVRETQEKGVFFKSHTKKEQKVIKKIITTKDQYSYCDRFWRALLRQKLLVLCILLLLCCFYLLLLGFVLVWGGGGEGGGGFTALKKGAGGKGDDWLITRKMKRAFYHSTSYIYSIPASVNLWKYQFKMFVILDCSTQKTKKKSWSLNFVFKLHCKNNILHPGFSQFRFTFCLAHESGTDSVAHVNVKRSLHFMLLCVFLYFFSIFQNRCVYLQERIYLQGQIMEKCYVHLTGGLSYRFHTVHFHQTILKGLAELLHEFLNLFNCLIVLCLNIYYHCTEQ